ncbi:hypothetical protein [Streptomyces thioluteus]|uniref:hypothetical protein n=1 Tax=Streptomyces thioluteus TaxID=66431 RepID=UPI0031E7FE2D
MRSSPRRPARMSSPSRGVAAADRAAQPGADVARRAVRAPSAARAPLATATSSTASSPPPNRAVSSASRRGSPR